MQTQPIPVETYTSEEYQRLPEEDGHTLELSMGRLIREPRPGARHGRIAVALFRALDSFVREHAFGEVMMETGFLLTDDPRTVRGPDLAFVSAARLPAGPAPEGFWEMAPDLAVEVVSPSNSAADLQEKVLQYLDAGALMVWLVQPRTRTVEEWRPASDGRILRENERLSGADVLSGFDLSIRQIFDV